MSLFRKLAATLLMASMCFTVATPSAYTATDLVYKNNTAQFELKTVRNIWGNGQTYEGHQGKITITNKDLVPLKQWVLEFDYDGDIKAVSNAVLVSKVNNHYIIKAPSSYHQVILPGRSLTFEFVGKSTSGDSDINNVLLYTADKPVQVTVIKSWALKTSYHVGDRVTFNGLNYKCRQAHTAQAFNWTPNLTPALWSLDKTPAPKSLDVTFNQ